MHDGILLARISITGAPGLLRIERKENRALFTQIRKDKRKSINNQVNLSEAPQIKNELAYIHDAYNDAAMKYPKKIFIASPFKSDLFDTFCISVTGSFFLCIR